MYDDALWREKNPPNKPNWFFYIALLEVLTRVLRIQIFLKLSPTYMSHQKCLKIFFTHKPLANYIVSSNIRSINKF